MSLKRKRSTRRVRGTIKKALESQRVYSAAVVNARQLVNVMRDLRLKFDFGSLEGTQTFRITSKKVEVANEPQA